MFKEAYQNGVLQALSDMGVAKTAAPNPSRVARLLEFVGKHPEPFGAAGGAGIGAGSTALGGGDLDDILLGAGVGALAGGVSGTGMRSLRNTKALQSMRNRLAQAEAEIEMTAMGIPKVDEAALAASKAAIRKEIANAGKQI